MFKLYYQKFVLLTILCGMTACTPPHMQQREEMRQRYEAQSDAQANSYAPAGNGYAQEAPQFQQGLPRYEPAPIDNDTTYSIPYKGEQERGEYMLLLVPEYE